MMFKGISASDERLEGIIDRMKHGSSLTQEARKLGYSDNRALRDALFLKVGRDAFQKLVPGSRHHDEMVMVYY